MTIETSTANVILGVMLSASIGLQTWIIRELFKLKTKVTIMLVHCRSCRHQSFEPESDTDRLVKPSV